LIFKAFLQEMQVPPARTVGWGVTGPVPGSQDTLLPTSRLLQQYSMHQLSADESVTCQSMLAQEPSSRVLVMPTHHINELGDMMGFR
jgi:hypothetical protein